MAWAMHERARKHLVAQLVEGNARAARNAVCQRCGADVLKGDDHDRVALVVTVDPEPITLDDELLDVLDGRATFTLERMRGKEARPGAVALHHRDEWQLTSTRPLRGTLHREHRCDPRSQKGSQCLTLF